MHLAHPLGVKAFSYRRVKNDERDAADLADLLRMGRLPEGGDWGAIVAWAIGRLADPAKLIGIHFNFALADPAKLMELGEPTEEEQRDLARLRNSS